MRRLVAPCAALAVALGVISPLSPPVADAAIGGFGVSTRVAGGGNGWSGPASRARLVSDGRVDAAPDGSVLVSQSEHVLRVRPSSDTLEVIAGVGGTVSSTAMSGVRDVAAHGANVVVATDAGVLQIAADGIRSSLLSSTTVRAVDVGADGVVWVAQINSVLRISGDGTVSEVTPEHPFGDLIDIAVSPDGAKAFVIDGGQDRWGVYQVTAAGLGARVAGHGQRGMTVVAGTPAIGATMADALSLTTDGTVITIALRSQQRLVSFAVGGNLRDVTTDSPCSGWIDRLGAGYIVMCGTRQAHPSVHGLTGGGVDEGRMLGADPARPWSPDGVSATDAYLDPVRGSASTPDGREVFTTNAGLVREVDAAGRLKTRTTLAPLKTGGKVAVGPDGTAYVVIDTGAVMGVATSGPAAVVSLDALASDVEVRPNGRIVVADRGAHRLLEADPHGGPVTVLTAAIGTPVDIGLDGDDVLVADSGLRRVGPAGTVTTLLTGGAPTAAAAGTDGVWTGALHSPDTYLMVLLPTGDLSPVRITPSSSHVSSLRATIQAEAAGSVLLSDGDVVTRITDAGLAPVAPAPAHLAATPGSGRVVLTWDVDYYLYSFSGMVVRAKRGATAPVDMWDGEQVAAERDVFRVGTALIQPGELWTFAVFAMTYRDGGGQVTLGSWSRAAVASAAANVDSTPPPPPGQPKVYADHTRLGWSWQDPTGDDFDHSVARMSLSSTAPQTPDDGVEIWRSEPGTLQHVAIPEPVPGQDYAVSVFTVDIHGLYTAWKTVTHLDFDAPAPVTGVAVTPSYFSATATFVPPAEADYDSVLYAVAEGVGTPSMTGSLSSRGQLWIGALKMGIDYTLALWSLDAAGNVSAPQLTHFTTLLDADPPSPATDLTATGGDWQITTSWTPPADSDLKDVELKLVDDVKGTVRTALAAPTDTNRTWNGLPGGHSFTLTATARDLRLNRSAPITASATTLPDANGRPPAIALEDIQLMPISSTQVTISFPPPNIADLAGIWWGLVPHGQPTAGVPLGNRFTWYGPTVSKTITLPEPLTSYQLVLSVVDFSHGAQTVVPDIHGVANAAELPGLPSALTVTSPFDNVLDVRFSRATSVNARPTSWLVTATSGSTVRTQTVSVAPDGSPVNGGARLVDLPGRLTWSVSVVGQNALGRGPVSTGGGVFVADMAPPAQVTRLVRTPAYDQEALAWVNPTNSDFDHVVVRRVGAAAAEALVVYIGRGTSARALGLVAGRPYRFEVRSYDRLGNGSLPVTVTTQQSVASVTSGSSVPYRSAIRVTGGLYWGGRPLASRPMSLFGQKPGSTVWTRLAGATTSSTGSYVFSVKPLLNTRYRVGYLGSGGAGGAYSLVRTVLVRPTVSIAANRSSMRLGTSATLSTKVTPSHRGARAYLQRWNGSSWVAVTSRKLSTTSAASATVRPSRRGLWRYHWVFPQHNDHGVGISRSFVIKVA